MPPLSDAIEAFIKALMDQESEQAQVELRRNELAEHFRCAPSQINYVLATRFTPDHGYLIESRRGGGGYIRIIRVAIGEAGEQLLQLAGRVGSAVSEITAEAIICGLVQGGLVSVGEARLMRAAIGALGISLPTSIKDALRAAALRNMLLALAHNEHEKQEPEEKED